MRRDEIEEGVIIKRNALSYLQEDWKKKYEKRGFEVPTQAKITGVIINAVYLNEEDYPICWSLFTKDVIKYYAKSTSD